MEVEELNASNLDALIPLTLGLWPETTYEEEHQHYQGLLDNPDQTCYLIKQQNDYIAFVHLSLRPDYVEGADAFPVAYVEGIYVAPEHRKTGIASRLISVAEDWAKAKGRNQLASDAEIQNHQSIAFHKSAGFKEANRVVCFIKNL